MTTQYLTVTALTKYIKRKFDADPHLDRVFLTGEVSNYRKRPRHQYFSIKDDHSLIQAVMYQREFNQLKFNLQDGMKVLLIGRVNVYEPSGSYNIVIEHMEPDGIGALYQAYTELKDKLSKEGLFSRTKRPLPAYPKKIAVVTSPSGAVIRDIMTTIKRRYPIAQIELYPTVVQGKGSVQSIVENLKQIDRQDDIDVAIIGRGGGSIEDLWSFNEEAVIRQIVEMNMPIISSVGHETDTTLSDLAADIRAATPTAAAELSVPVLADLIQGIQQSEQRLYRALKNKLAVRQETLNRLMHSYVFRQPKRLYEGHLQKLDQLSTQLQQQTQQHYQNKSRQFEQLDARLRAASPRTQLVLAQRSFENLDKLRIASMTRYMDQKKRDFSQVIESLDLLSPLKIMARGYSYTTLDQTIVKSVQQLALAKTIDVHLQDGIVRAEVIDIQEEHHE